MRWILQGSERTGQVRKLSSGCGRCTDSWFLRLSQSLTAAPAAQSRAGTAVKLGSEAWFGEKAEHTSA
jgi:hypothetical protein